MVKFKGSVASFSDLPSAGNTAGDLYTVQSDGMYAWTGNAWVEIGTTTIENNNTRFQTAKYLDMEGAKYMLHRIREEMNSRIKDLEEAGRFDYTEIACRNCGAKLEQGIDDHIVKCPYCVSVYAIGRYLINSV